ncbi:MAG: 4Fe-4S binding protein [Deltaproteobacteria bacterium]|nr:4Fe-4S binding protein [Deltaproteobacteria bacterium]PWB62526.1 MAG: ferredoxin [Deltaproteobacteria bacterium]
MWKQRRRIAALAQGAVILALPFLEIGGESALRFDIPGGKLLFFGTTLWLSEFHLLLLGTLAVLLLVLAVTVVFGRVWCGWVCPQTVLPELSSWASCLLPASWRKTGGKAVLFLLSGAASLSVIAYFVPPSEAGAVLFRSRIAAGIFLVQWAVFFFMLALLGPTFCRTVCPYSMFQNLLFDERTLTVGFDRSRMEECPRCERCVSICPVKIDIREGAQRECIACAACIDACRAISDRQAIRPFIAYRGTIRRPKAALWGGAAAAAGLAFLLLLLQKPDVSLLVQWEAKIAGAPANSYRYTVRNDGGRPVALALRLDGEGTMYGEKEIQVGPRTRKTGKVIVRREENEGGSVTFVAEGQGLSLSGKAVFP